MILGPSGARRAVFLDRDGVLVESVVRDGLPFSPRNREEMAIVQGAAESCDALRRAGFLLVVVTNQPDIARGDLTLAELSSMHQVLVDRIPIDAVLVCPHDDDDHCLCRKPAPGLLLDAAARFGISLPRSVMIGDRWRDVAAGRRAGCWTVFVDARYREQRPEGHDLEVSRLSEAVPWILANHEPRKDATR